MPLSAGGRCGGLAVVLAWVLAASAQAGPMGVSAGVGQGAGNWWFGGGSPFVLARPISLGVFAPLPPGYLRPIAASPPVSSISAPPVTAPVRMVPVPTPALSSTPNRAPAPPPASAGPSAVPQLATARALAAATPAPAPPAAEGFINMGAGPYPQTGTVASGNPQPWYDSPQIVAAFGGAPDPGQQADFTSAVLQRVRQTFQLSGVAVDLTTDPNVTAAHTVSVVSRSSSVPFPGSIGTSLIGGDGFSFIDEIGKSATTLDQLKWVVAHNVAHELMLTFGVPEEFDQSGNYLDSTHANWSMITSPTATFSPDASRALNDALAASGEGKGAALFAQFAAPGGVPEPAALLAWGLGALACLAGRARRARGSAAGPVGR